MAFRRSGVKTSAHKTHPHGICTQLFPFLLSKQIVHANAVRENEDCSWAALCDLRRV